MKIDFTNVGYHIKHTMELLETSTKEHPNKVRIAIEGQSISDPSNKWTHLLEDWIRERYPDADIEFRNFAIGGFSTSILRKRVPNDMKEFKPHLVILNVFGNHYHYEDIVKEIRSAGAELMIQTAHYTVPDGWADRMAYEFLPDYAARYSCELCRVRDIWKDYLDEVGAEPKEFLAEDMTHLNPKGQQLMFDIMKELFVWRKDERAGLPLQISKRPEVRLEEKDWKDGAFEFTFVGTGVEILDFATDEEIEIEIDGLKPSEIKDCYVRSTEYYDMWHTNIGQVRFLSVPQEQDWRVEITECTSPESFHVAAYGSVTGFEGEGDDQLEGKHLFLDKDSFIFDYIFDFEKDKSPKSLTLGFKTIFNATDRVKRNEPLILGGLADSPHVLTGRIKKN